MNIQYFVLSRTRDTTVSALFFLSHRSSLLFFFFCVFEALDFSLGDLTREQNRHSGAAVAPATISQACNCTLVSGVTLALFAGGVKHVVLNELVPAASDECDPTIGTLPGSWAQPHAQMQAQAQTKASGSSSVHSGGARSLLTQQTESDSERDSDASSADLDDEAPSSATAAASDSEREPQLHELLQSYLQRVRHTCYRSAVPRQCGQSVLLSVDELIQLRVEPELARLVLAVRHKWNALLLRRLRQPGKSASAQDEQLLRTIITVLTNEEQALGLQQPAGVGQRPKPMNASIVNLEDGSHTGSAINVSSAYATRIEPTGTGTGTGSPPPPPYESEATSALECTLKSEELRALGDTRFQQPPRRAALAPRLCSSAAGSGSRLNSDETATASGLSPLLTSLALEQQKTRARRLDVDAAPRRFGGTDAPLSALEQTLTDSEIRLQQHDSTSIVTGSTDAAFSAARRASVGAMLPVRSLPPAIAERSANALCDALFGTPLTHGGDSSVQRAFAEPYAGLRAGPALPSPGASMYAQESPRASAASATAASAARGGLYAGAGGTGGVASVGARDTRYFVMKSQSEQLLDVSFSCLLWPVRAHSSRLLRAAAKALFSFCYYVLNHYMFVSISIEPLSSL